MIRVFAVVLAVEYRKRKVDAAPTSCEREVIDHSVATTNLLSPDFKAFVIG